MNVSTRIMSFDKTKANQEKCNCRECINTKTKNHNLEYLQLSEAEIERIVIERYSDKDEKTKNFIRKALKVHGDKYDYSKVNYINNKMKVEIICRIENHKLFLQTPDNHLHGQGCKLCANKCRKGRSKLTNDSFIRKANEIHGIGRYDYSKVNYTGALNKVCIICHKHNKSFEFLQTANDHLRGAGCPSCYGIKKLTINDFIERANEVHGTNRYDYSKVKYKNVSTKVCIICHKHGKPYEFWQKPSSHLRGNRCPKCYGTIKLTKDDFIEKANKVHGEGTYDYSKVNYVNNHTKICIICNNHNKIFEFWQQPNDHLQGRGCPLCGVELRKLTLNKFIERANKIHDKGTYDYSKVIYSNCDTKVEIICLKHGSFWQTPFCHLKGTGCPKCNKNKGEESIRKFLIEKEIEFEEQKKFEGCEYKRQLKFDFYLPKYNLCIESDGNVHSDKINWNGKLTNEQMKKELKLNQHRDKIKNNYCKNKGINLVRVNNLKAIKELTEYFQIHGIIKEQTIFDLVS